MKINHTAMHYVIGAAALGLAAHATLAPPSPVASVHELQRPSKFDWPVPSPDQVTNLGEILKGQKPGKVTVFCRSPQCHDLELSLDDAFQIAEWHEDLETLPVDSEESRGIFVGPPGPPAEFVAAELKQQTGLDAEIVPIDGIEGVGIIIGKVAR